MSETTGRKEMKLEQLAMALMAGCPIRRPDANGGWKLIKSINKAMSMSVEDALADDWELWPRNEKEKAIGRSHQRWREKRE
tara:strand:- start:361 stop:603 length:243 start_codon:yes stop_codon:yes gene_type:complete